MRGVLKFKGALRFDGNFQGEILTSDMLIVGNTGKIEAKVEAGSLYNMGEIVGNIKAGKKISLFNASQLDGNIDTPMFVSEEGAIFRGSCAMPSSPPPKTSGGDSDLKRALEKSIAGVSVKRTGGNGSGSIVKSGLKKLAFFLLFAVMVAAGAGGWFVYESRDKIGSHPYAREIYKWFAMKENDAEKLAMLGDVYFNEKDYTSAVENYRVAKAANPNITSIFKNFAFALETLGKMEEASLYYEKNIRMDSGDTATIAKLMDYYTSINSVDRLIKLQEFLMDKDPEDREAAMKLFTLYRDNNRLENALELYEKKLAASPRKPEDLLVIGRLERDMDRVQSAIKTFAKYVELDPSSKEGRLELAYIYHKGGYESTAAQEFYRIGRMDPNHAEAHNNAGFLKLSKGQQTDAAIEHFNAALAVEPNNLRAFLGLATTYSRLGNSAKAEEYCKKILEIDANYSPALNRLAWVYAQDRKNLDLAEKLSLSSMRYDKNIPEYIDTLSEVYYQKGDYDKAIEMIEHAIDLDPANAYFKAQHKKFTVAKKKG